MTVPDFVGAIEGKTPDFVGLIEREKPQPKQPSPAITTTPDFVSLIQKPQKQDYREMVRVPEKTPEELNKMSISDRRSYIEDLNREREYLQSRGFIKGGLSGLSLGLSEKIPGLKPDEEDLLIGLGEFVGSSLPISKLYNFLGKPLVNLAAKSPIARKGLESLARMTGFGLTGATYEGTKETIKTGEPPSPEELAKYGAQWAAFDGVLQLLGKAASFAPKLKEYAFSKKIPVTEALNEVIETLASEGINPETNPKKAVARAEQIIGGKAEQLELFPEAKKEVKPIGEPKVPLVETTGEGAAERIEYPKTGLDKSIETMNNLIKAAKTPSESLKRLGEQTNTAIFNALAPLERLEMDIPIHQKVSTRIKLAQSAASEVNSVLENGIFSNVTGNFEHEGLKGAYGDLTWKKLTKNLLPDEFSIEELDAFRVSKAALKRQAEGKKVGVDTKRAIHDINILKNKYEPIDKRIRGFQQATLKTYGKDLLGPALIEKWNKEYYAPLFRVMEEGEGAILKSGSLAPKQPFKKMVGSERKIIPPSESDPFNASMLISNARKNDAILQYRKLVLEGKLPGKIRTAKNDPIPKAVLEALELDRDMVKVAEQLYNQTRQKAFNPQNNTLRGWKDGKPFEIEVPEDIYNVFSSIAPQERGSLAKTFSFFNRMFSRGISLEPRKFASIVSRDALSSLIYSRTGSNPISIAEALSDIYNAKPVYKEFLAMGGDVYASKLAERVDRGKRIEDLISPSKEGILVPFEKMGDFFKKYTHTLGDISLAVPLGEYKRALAKYGNTAEGRIMAAMEARRVTYDPTVKGNAKIVRELGNFVPFWNVSLQDMAMIGRNLNTPSTWVKGFTAITGPTLALKMMNEGNPEYEALTPVDKAAFWHLYYGDQHVRIPIPWLLGTTFKVVAETFYDSVMELGSKGDPRAKDAWKGLYHNFVENLSGKVPPLLQNYIEMSTGKSAPSPVGLVLQTESRAPEVIPRRLQDLPPELQATAKTSQLARWFGQYWGISPIKLEKTITGLGGLVAKDVLGLMDEIAYFTGLADDIRPEQRETNYLLLGNFVSSGPNSRTKYANEFYDYLREATVSKNAQKVIREKGITDPGLDEIDFASVPLFSYNRKISQYFKQMRTVEEDSSIDAAEKKRKLNNIQIEINHLYRKAVEEVRNAKSAKYSED